MKLFDRSLPIILASLLLLVLAQGISGSLSMLSFEQRQMQTIVSSYEAVGLNLVAKIERALSLGKPLGNFIGMETLLSDGKKMSADLENIGILDNHGGVLYSLADYLLPEKNSVAGLNWDDSAGASQHLQHQMTHFLLFPLRKDVGEITGFVFISFDDDTLAGKRQSIVFRSTQFLLVCTLVAAIFLIFGSGLIRKRFGGLRRVPLMWLVILVLAAAQLLSSWYNVLLFRADYLQLLEVKANITAKLLADDIESLLHKGLRINTLFNIEKQLSSVARAEPEISALVITDNDGNILYKSSDSILSSAENVRIPLSGRKGIAGALNVQVNSRVIHDSIRDIILNSLTVVLLSMLFAAELLRFLLAMMRDGHAVSAEASDGLVSGIGKVRAVVFLYIFAASLSVSFIPLHMAALYQPVTGFSKELVLGLPLFLEMLGGGLILIPAGAWIDRRGWHWPFLVGVLLSCGGALWSGYAANHFQFMAARLLAGLGYGLGWMSAQGYVLQNTPPDQRARGISSVVAGIFAGIICGNGMGALVADRIGFSQVFYLGGMVMVVVLILVLSSLRSTFHSPHVALGQSNSLRVFFRLLGDPQALLIFVCSLIPYSIVMVGLLYYITPLFLSEEGVSQSDIGRVIMLFGLSMIFIAPQVSKIADRMSDKRGLVIAGGIIGGGCLLPFYFTANLWVVVIAVLLFGFSVSISGASRNVLTLNLPVSQQIGSSQVMGIYRSVDKLGQALGALVPAALMSWLSVSATMLVIGLVYLFATLILVLGLKRQVF